MFLLGQICFEPDDRAFMAASRARKITAAVLFRLHAGGLYVHKKDRPKAPLLRGG